MIHFIRLAVLGGLAYMAASQYPQNVPTDLKMYLGSPLPQNIFVFMCIMLALLWMIAELVISRRRLVRERNKALAIAELTKSQVGLHEDLATVSDEHVLRFITEAENDLTQLEQQFELREHERNRAGVRGHLEQLRVRQTALQTRIDLANSVDEGLAKLTHNTTTAIMGLERSIDRLASDVEGVDGLTKDLRDLEARLVAIENLKPSVATLRQEVESIDLRVSALSNDEGLSSQLEVILEKRAEIETTLDEIALYDGENIADVIVRQQEFATKTNERLEVINKAPETLKALKEQTDDIEKAINKLSDGGTDDVIDLIGDIIGRHEQIEETLGTIEAGHEDYKGDLEDQVNDLVKEAQKYNQRIGGIQKHLETLASTVRVKLNGHDAAATG